MKDLHLFLALSVEEIDLTVPFQCAVILSDERSEESKDLHLHLALPIEKITLTNRNSGGYSWNNLLRLGTNDE